MTDAMSPSQKDDDGQEWEAGTRLRFHYGIPQDLLDELAADHRDARQFREQRMCRMQGGPPIPWSIAEEIHRKYVELHGNIQSLERINERGGFGWAEVQWMFTIKDRRQKDFDAAVAAVEFRAEERVRVLEEALVKRAPLTRCPLCHVEPKEWVESEEPGALPICEACALDVSGPVFASPRTLLPSPVTTEGGEGA